MVGKRRLSFAVLFGVVLILVIGIKINNQILDIKIIDKFLKFNSYSAVSQKKEEFDWKNFDSNTLSARKIIDYLYWTNSSSCRLAHDFGGRLAWNPSAFDGQKSVCLDPPVRPEAENCIVYSFGINNDWSFDDIMEKYGCEIFSFDPSMNISDHDRSERVHFYKIGLGDKDYTSDKGWKIKSLSSIYKMLLHRHGEETIDYLKMDIESSEWLVLPQIIKSKMLNKVRQLGVEFHFETTGNLKQYQTLVGIIKSIEDAGMIRFSSKYNPWYKGKIEALENYEGSLGFEMAFYQVISS